MLEICEQEQSQPQVFCQAISYLDTFLNTCNIRRSQLQLLGSVCLLVSWKVREHSCITANKLIQFTDYNISLHDLLEWEFLLLSKLDWDLSRVTAPDLTEHLLQRVCDLGVVCDLDSVRRDSSTLMYLCYCHMSTASLPPSLIAAASLLTTFTPLLESSTRDTPSPSSSSSTSTTSTPDKVDCVERVLDAVTKIANLDKVEVKKLTKKIEQLMRDSLPPSPNFSDEEDISNTARILFQDKEETAIKKLVKQDDIVNDKLS